MRPHDRFDGRYGLIGTRAAHLPDRLAPALRSAWKAAALTACSGMFRPLQPPYSNASSKSAQVAFAAIVCRFCAAVTLCRRRPTIAEESAGRSGDRGQGACGWPGAERAGCGADVCSGYARCSGENVLAKGDSRRWTMLYLARREMGSFLQENEGSFQRGRSIKRVDRSRTISRHRRDGDQGAGGVRLCGRRVDTGRAVRAC